MDHANVSHDTPQRNSKNMLGSYQTPTLLRGRRGEEKEDVEEDRENGEEEEEEEGENGREKETRALDATVNANTHINTSLNVDHDIKELPSCVLSSTQTTTTTTLNMDIGVDVSDDNNVAPECMATKRRERDGDVVMTKAANVKTAAEANESTATITEPLKKRKRGRPKGSKNKKNKQHKDLNKTTLSLSPKRKQGCRLTYNDTCETSHQETNEKENAIQECLHYHYGNIPGLSLDLNVDHKQPFNYLWWYCAVTDDENENKNETETETGLGKRNEKKEDKKNNNHINDNNNNCKNYLKQSKASKIEKNSKQKIVNSPNQETRFHSSLLFDVNNLPYLDNDASHFNNRLSMNHFNTTAHSFNFIYNRANFELLYILERPLDIEINELWCNLGDSSSFLLWYALFIANVYQTTFSLRLIAACLIQKLLFQAREKKVCLIVHEQDNCLVIQQILNEKKEFQPLQTPRNPRYYKNEPKSSS
ncbi:endochitinase [Reticulomyxa filosa]|uniref:Endochitinase n=1 Tax=Reticulomyxa filosa TaxID=46433 RepID=X6NAY4_RETFI|nr:endochitinase [Reticulomyxa filosa]|eukprot:ETO23435.1 endochitinase [Reticulomyxa filosa]